MGGSHRELDGKQALPKQALGVLSQRLPLGRVNMVQSLAALFGNRLTHQTGFRPALRLPTPKHQA